MDTASYIFVKEGMIVIWYVDKLIKFADIPLLIDGLKT